ncbi:MAG: hypothetical protein WC071_01555 [Victivallaceae bacterium]
MHKQLSVLTFLACMTVLRLSAGEPEIILKNGSRLKVPAVVADEAGNLLTVIKKRDVVIGSDDYRYVKTSRPAELNEVAELVKAGKWNEAEKILSTIGGKYDYPNLRAEYRYLAAMVFIGQKKPDKAENILKVLLDDDLSDPEHEREAYAKAFRMLGGIYQEKGEDDNVLATARKIIETGGSPEDVVWAGNTAGDMLLKKDKPGAAVKYFLQSVILFDKNTPGRDKSLYEICKYLKAKDINQYNFYSGILKKQYPDSTFIAKLNDL